MKIDYYYYYYYLRIKNKYFEQYNIFLDISAVLNLKYFLVLMLCVCVCVRVYVHTYILSAFIIFCKTSDFIYRLYYRY